MNNLFASYNLLLLLSSEVNLKLSFSGLNFHFDVNPLYGFKLN